MKLDYIIRNILEFIGNQEQKKNISDYIISNYLELLKNKNRVYDRIDEISLYTSKEILNTIFSKYSMFPQWIILQYINKDDIYNFTREMLIDNKDYINGIDELENIVIKKPEMYNLDKIFTDYTLWKTLIIIVFMDIELTSNCILFDIKYFSIFYEKL